MKTLSSVLVALAAAGFMPVCGAEAQTIALFTKNNTNPFSQAIRVGSNAAAVALGVKVVHYVPTTPDNVAEQAKLVDDAGQESLVPLRVEPRGIIEPFAWMMSQVG